MYLELHRGTLISQQRTKRGNRHSEALLREAELWADHRGAPAGRAVPGRRSSRTPGAPCCCSSSTTSSPAPRSPGSTRRRSASTPRSPSVARAPDRRPRWPRWPTAATAPLAANAGPFARHGRAGAWASVAVAAPAAGDAPRRRRAASCSRTTALRVVVDARGVLVSVRDLVGGPGGAARGHRRRRAAAAARHPARVGRLGHQRGGPAERPGAARARRGAQSTATRSSSGTGSAPPRVEVRLRLVDGRLDYAFDIDWHESQKLLKLAFPLDLRADRARRPRSSSGTCTGRSTATRRGTPPASRPSRTAGSTSASPAGASRSRTTSSTATTCGPSRRRRAARWRSRGSRCCGRPRSPTRPPTRGAHAFTVSLRPGGIPEAIADGYAQHLPSARPARRARRAAAHRVGPGRRRRGGQAGGGPQRRPRACGSTSPTAAGPKLP